MLVPKSSKLHKMPVKSPLFPVGRAAECKQKVNSQAGVLTFEEEGVVVGVHIHF